MSLIAIIVAVFLFLLLILAHEFGHYTAARIVGVKINEFSVGMGPRIWHQEQDGTEYSIRLLPIGGYCALEGENGDSDDEGSFSNQSSVNKIFVLIAGAFNNIVLAIAIMIILFTAVGTVTNKIGSVIEGCPAAEAGLMPGDEIIAVDGKATGTWNEVITEISNGSEDIQITVNRKKEQLTIMCPTYTNESGRTAIGITVKVEHSLINGIRYSWETTVDFMKEMWLFFARLFKWQVKSDEVMGVVGIVNVVSESAQYGISNVIYLMCIISLNLGVINLLPLPALDGGRILFVVLRKIFKNKISDKTEGIVHTVGMVLLMILMIYLVINDILRIVR